MQPELFTGYFGDKHIQGIAVDLEKGYVYCSFTTQLVKLTLDGRLVGSVVGLAAHLGCIAFHTGDGKVYGSLEYKHDAIGKSLVAAIGEDVADGFYAAIFDVDRIDRVGMNAETDGVMTAVFLKEPTDDYNGTGVAPDGSALPHKYACSGIDGTAVGPMFGAAPDSKPYLMVAYGVYGDTERDDNDHQVICAYDLADLAAYARPLAQRAMHRSGPEKPAGKFFAFTGNTEYGVQNLEYDAAHRAYWMALYCGQKANYPNFSLMAIDASVAPKSGELQGIGETGNLLTLAKMGICDAQSQTYGWHFPHGTCGLYAVGDGTYYIARHHRDEQGCAGYIGTYRFDGETPFARI
ncbi:MAG: hypothetical protein IKC99_02885 [Clostridia bacterium]|nr:hypothetical protein [Clostridia bacterium]